MNTMPMPSRPQNVIWITTDHLRHDFVGAYGTAWMHTPSIDRLAAHGIRFDHCYCNAPLCMPSRASFMTGCYPCQTGVMTNGQELPDGRLRTAADCFQSAGYRTLQIGKLHLQNHCDSDLEPRTRSDYGFEVLHVSEEPGCYEDAYRCWLRGEHPEWVETFTVPRPNAPDRARDATHAKVLRAPWQYSHSGWVAQQAIRQLFAWPVGDRPRFAHLGFYAPHPPLNPTHEMMAPYEDGRIPDAIGPQGSRLSHTYDIETIRQYRRHFAAMVTGVDFAIGSLLEALEAHHQLDDTLLVFSSDHGDLCGDHGGLSKGYSYYDGIMRLPLVLHWPNGLGRGPRTIPGMVEMVDLLPTLLGLCGISAVPAISGCDWSAALLHGTGEVGRDSVLAMGPHSLMLRTPRHKYLRYLHAGHESEVLYDLDSDPQEMRDQAQAVGSDMAKWRRLALDRLIEASNSPQPLRLPF